jgi:hypothetical protein
MMLDWRTIDRQKISAASVTPSTRSDRIGGVTRLKISIPLYSYPNWYSPDLYIWPKIAAAAPDVEITAIINPHNGPDSGPPNSDYQKGLADLAAAGIKIVGYIHTDYGRRDLQDVARDIHLYARYFGVEGIFVDEIATSLDCFAYNQQVAKTIKIDAGLEQAIFNPGTHIHERYLNESIADTIVLFENDYAAWKSYQPPSYIHKYSPQKFAAASDLGFGHIYITDGHNRPPSCNPWSTLPSYWPEEIKYLSLDRSKGVN